MQRFRAQAQLARRGVGLPARKDPVEPPQRHGPGDDRDGVYSSYFVLTGPETIFDGSTGAGFADITDGMSNTVLVVEAKRDIPWTKPEDISFDGNLRLADLGGFGRDGANVAFADGSVRFISTFVNPTQLNAMITKAGGEALQEVEFVPDRRGTSPPPSN